MVLLIISLKLQLAPRRARQAPCARSLWSLSRARRTSTRRCSASSPGARQSPAGASRASGSSSRSSRCTTFPRGSTPSRRAHARTDVRKHTRTSARAHERKRALHARAQHARTHARAHAHTRTSWAVSSRVSACALSASASAQRAKAEHG
eukprot:2419441-Pleurochrysis_carterae.AAC.6